MALLLVLLATPVHPQTSAFDAGLAKLRAKNWAGCIADFDRVIAVEPANAAAYSNRSLCKNRIED